MKFKLLEGKQELKAKYGDNPRFEEIYNSIPLKLKGYGDWFFNNALTGKPLKELVDTLNTFLKYKDRLEIKDINKYSSKEDVDRAIHGAIEKGSKKEKLYNAELVYEDEKVKVVIPLTHEASRHYGTGTNWCTATANSSYFDEYKMKGKLFYILPKDGEDKYAIFSYFKFNSTDEQKMEGFDDKDTSTNPEEIIKKFGLNKELFSALLVFSFKTKEGIEKYLNFLKIKNFKINENLVVDVEGGVNLSGVNLSKFFIQFGKVGGNFYCSDNKLTSLQGGPQEVGGDFYCVNNELTSLQGAPQEVGGNFYCFYNKLTSLRGAPQKVGGDFDCSDNKLTSLRGAPQKVGGGFYCSNNKLTSSEIERVKKIYKRVIESVRKIKFKVVE
jgi:hypothetical protein